MNSNNTTCCGTVGPKRKINKAKIPKNPEITNGTKLIYLGAGVAKITGKHTGLIYYVSDYQRHFVVDKEDAKAILKKAAFILEP